MQEADKPSKIAKLYFWLFIFFATVSSFLFWSGTRPAPEGAQESSSNLAANVSLIIATIFCMLAILFGVFTFIRFIRTRSVTGGLFMTVAISTAVFLGTSQLIGFIVTPAVFAMDAGGVGAGFETLIVFAKVGLFAIWFLFLLFTIYMQVSPVRKIDRALERIVDGDQVKRFKIGKSKQYRSIEKKLGTLSQELQEKRCKIKVLTSADSIVEFIDEK